MAINSKKYVDISTTFPTIGARSRAFGGLVFTYGELTGVTEDSTGKPKPKKTDGSDYGGSDGNWTVTVNGTTAQFVWNNETGYVATIAGKEYYPDNDVDIKLWIAFHGGKDISLALDDVKRVFTESSTEYEFARGYYSYISPSGRFPSILRFAKVAADQKPLDAFITVDKSTNQFGSFTFLTPTSTESDSTSSTTTFMEDLKEVAVYNDTLDGKYLFVVNYNSETSISSEIEQVEAAAKVFEDAKVTGCCFLYGGSKASAYMPMAIMASTDYAAGQVVSYMFKQFSYETPVVQDDKTYAALNQALVNFYGMTQTNGQTLAFYQRGNNTDGNETAVYCNEVWFKAECETRLLQLLIASDRISADAVGVATVKLEVTDACSAATRNGCFMQKDVSTTDIRNIREIVYLSGGSDTDVDSIVADVGSKGYSVYAYLSSISDPTIVGRGTEKIIVYYVFYGTADSIRHIKGNDILLK